MPKKHKLNLYIDESLIEPLKLHAVREKTSVSAIVEQLLNAYVAKLDDKRKRSTGEK